jgi:C4-type Zn-finger protein|tara:strand:+ start:3742 stop:3984 length:243 start_codon:yes stop_codon:yes gene_type:complete
MISESKCPICEKHYIKLVTHHIDKNHNNNSMQNLIIICNKCHTAIHIVDFNDLKRISKRNRSYYSQETIYRIKQLQKKLI